MPEYLKVNILILLPYHTCIKCIFVVGINSPLSISRLVQVSAVLKSADKVLNILQREITFEHLGCIPLTILDGQCMLLLLR